MYLLIRTLPDGMIRADSTPHLAMTDAARSAGMSLYDNTRTSKADAQRFSRRLSDAPVSTILDHESGYRFRILTVDRTSNGVPITPGLRVRNNDQNLCTIDRAQFMDTGSLMPGGEYFDHWYYVLLDGEDRPQTRFNGERLTTRF